MDGQKHTLAKYLMELTLPEYSFVKYDPSEIAAAALCIATKILDQSTEWVSAVAIHSFTFCFVLFYFFLVDCIWH